MTERTEATMGSLPPSRVLSLDGGGIRGISSLLILEEIMEKLRDVMGLDTIPRPCEFFDLIGGTSTGGIIAIMLGRLGMTVDECIRAYRDVAQQAFIPKRTTILPASPAGAFSAKALESAVKRMTRKFCVEPGCVSRRSNGLSTTETCPHGEMEFRDRSCTKTVVLSITKGNVDALPTLFSTYDTAAGFHGCTIWQVARATSAATTFFKPIKVGRDGIEFVDAGFGYNNPCEVLIEEARRQFPGRSRMRVLSIGTGLGDVVAIGNTRKSILDALKKMATSSKKVAARLNSQYGDDGHYYRFNVDQGLQDITLSDWEKHSDISAHTLNYLKENRRKIKKFVDDLVTEQAEEGHDSGPVQTSSGRALDRGVLQEMPSTSLHDTQMAATRTAGDELGAAMNYTTLPCYYIPLPNNKRFVGRDSTLKSLQDMLFMRKECQKAAVVGLGGVGKTQVALQLAYWAKKYRPEHSVFWVPALSRATFEQAYTEMARELPLQKDSANKGLKDSIRRYLSSEAAGPWLLVVDNADDSDLLLGSSDISGGLNKYLPESEDGLVLFTTRSREVAVSVAGNDIIELHEMDPQEATDYLEKSLIRSNKVGMAELLKELTYLPLAITQAAAYLNKAQLPITEYLRLLRGTDQDMASLMDREFHDSTRYSGSQNAVARTWLLSFDQIRKSDDTAANLLSFLSCIEPKGIPQSILPRLELEEPMVHAIGILCGYAFLTRRGDSNIFDMHSLVHLAARIWIQRKGHTAMTIEKAIRHLATVFPHSDYENRNLWREYLPHAFKVLQHSEGLDIEEKSNLWFRVGRCLRVDGRIKEAVRYLGETCQWRNRHCAKDHPDRLASQYGLAGAYEANGQVKEAIALLEQVVAIRAKTLAKDHPDRLASQHGLAGAYKANGQIEEAIALLEQVVAIGAKTLAKDHPSRLASQHGLAGAYEANGQVKEAIALFEQVVAIRAKTLAKDHPDRLASQHGLAGAYEANGQVKEAIALFEQVVAIRAKTLAKDHPSRLASQHGLAGAYKANGQVKEAIALLEQVVAIRAKTLAKDHPSRLASQHGLAGAYEANGQVKEAIALFEQVVAIRAKTLAKDHPDQLTSQHGLAGAYKANGQIEEAIALLEQVVAIEAKTLAEDHPSRLASQHGLAGAYEANGQVKEAIALFEQVVAIRAKTLAKDHPDRLASQHGLAGAYEANGQVKEAIALFEQVVAIGAKTLAKDHPSRLASQHGLAGAYEANGQVKEAIALFEQVVAIRAKTLAKDHPSRLASQHGLAGAYEANGQVKEAIALFEQVVAIKAKTLAEDHPSRLASQHGLAGAYEANGQVKEAIALFEQVVAIGAKTLAKDHPDQLTSQHGLAGAYKANGQIEEAIALLEQVVAIEAKTLAEDHPSRLASQYGLAIAYKANGQVKEAITLLEQVVAIGAKTLAKDHPDRLASQHGLAGAYKANGQIEEAIALLEQVVAIEAKTLAEDHPSRLASQYGLAIAYKANGQVKEAITLLEQVVAIGAKTLAKDHPDRLASQHGLAGAYKANGQIEEAIALLEQVVAIEAKTLAEDHPSRLASQYGLAIAYKANGQVKEAITLLEQVVAIGAKTLAKDHPDRLVSERVLANLLQIPGSR